MGLRSPPTQNQNTSDSDRSLDAATKAKASLAKRGISDHSVTSNLPVGFLQHLDLRKSVYGYIDREDCTLFPLIRPGSLVQIDARQRKVSAERWRTEFDRPIYFVELRNGCVCSWCQVDRGQLIVIPHPHSHQSNRRTSLSLLGRDPRQVDRNNDANCWRDSTGSRRVPSWRASLNLCRLMIRTVRCRIRCFEPARDTDYLN